MASGLVSKQSILDSKKHQISLANDALILQKEKVQNFKDSFLF